MLTTYSCWDPDQGNQDDAVTVDDYSAASAAEWFAEQVHSAGHGDGPPESVAVLTEGEDYVRVFKIIVESYTTHSYTAEE